MGGYIDTNGRYYEGDMRPGDRSATAEEQAVQAAAVAVLAEKQAAEQANVLTVTGDPTITYLRTHSPAECYSKVQSDVTDLASAKQMLGRFAMALCVLTRRL